MSIQQLWSYIYLAAAGIFWGMFLVLWLMTYISSKQSRGVESGGIGIEWILSLIPFALAVYLTFLALAHAAQVNWRVP